MPTATRAHLLSCERLSDELAPGLATGGPGTKDLILWGCRLRDCQPPTKSGERAGAQRGHAHTQAGVFAVRPMLLPQSQTCLSASLLVTP